MTILQKFEDQKNKVLAWVLIYKDKSEVNSVFNSFKEEVEALRGSGFGVKPMKVLTEKDTYKITDFASSLGNNAYFLSMPEGEESERVLSHIHNAYQDFIKNGKVGFAKLAKEELLKEGYNPESEVDAVFHSYVEMRMQKLLDPYKKIDCEDGIEEIEV